MVILEEGTDIFQYVSERNRARQYDFLRTAFEVSQATSEFRVGEEFLCDLNYFAVKFLCEQPGRYREGIDVTVGAHNPPGWENVRPQMVQFWNNLDRLWDRFSPIECAAYALWGVNHIHPFVQGNGRSSRALAYFVLCRRFGMWLPGKSTIIEQIRIAHRDEYCNILQKMDGDIDVDGLTKLDEMVAFLERLLTLQLQSAD